jgi:hypothetical protein
MVIQLTTYQRYVNFWNSYNWDIKLEMVHAIEKNAGWAIIGFTSTVNLYAIYLKDGKKVYTDLAGFRKLLKKGRELGMEFPIIK